MIVSRRLCTNESCYLLDLCRCYAVVYGVIYYFTLKPTFTRIRFTHPCTIVVVVIEISSKQPIKRLLYFYPFVAGRMGDGGGGGSSM